MDGGVVEVCLYARKGHRARKGRGGASQDAKKGMGEPRSPRYAPDL